MNKTICKNPWCKSTFEYDESEMILSENSEMDPPLTCKKCASFDKELSSGISWTNKEYEGSRFDGMPHQMTYKVTTYK